MKYTFISLVFAIFYISTYACDCAINSFCYHIQSDYFIDSEGIVCIAEFTGNKTGDYNFSAIEMKLIDLLYGGLQPGSGNYLNTDSIFWILLGQGASCYNNSWIFNNAGDQFVMAPTYGDIFTGFDDSDTTRTGYSLHLCAHDVFPYQNIMIGPLISNQWFTQEIDTVAINQFPDLFNNCINCKDNLDLPGPHDFQSVYSASSTILSSADVNANVLYKANDRITLNTGFKTDPSINFGVRVDGCNYH